MLLALARKLPKPVKASVRRLLELTRDGTSTLLGTPPNLTPPNQSRPERTPLGHSSIDRLVLDAARENLVRANAHGDLALPDPGSRWGSYAAGIRARIETFQTIAEAVGFAQIHIGFEMRAMPPQSFTMVEAQLGSMRSCYPAFAQALETCCESVLSDQSHPGPVVSIGDSRYTTSHLSVVEHMFYIVDRLGRFPNSVLEIGGGYGAPARAWLTCGLGRPRRFAILDLAESLFFSEVFLKAHFGIEAVVNLADPRAMSRAGQATVILCPVQRMDLLEKFEFEVVINTGSMQEMTDEWITVYMDFLSKLNAGYFYSANYFLQPINRMNESMNLWSPRVKADWTLQEFDFCSATEESDFRSSLRALYRRDQNPAEIAPLSLEKAIMRIEARSPNEPLTQQEGEDLALFMDAFRKNPSLELTLRWTRALSSRFPLVFKELGFLVDWLLSRRAGLAPQDATEMEALRTKLTGLRAAGNEGLV